MAGNGDRYDPRDITAAAGVDLGVGPAGELDEIAADPSLPDGPNVIGHAPDTAATPGIVPGIAPPIGSGGEAGKRSPDGSPSYKDGVYAENILHKIQEGDLEGSLSLISDISSAAVVDILMPEVRRSVRKYADKLIGSGASEDIVHTLAFEHARSKASNITEDDIRLDVMAVLDEAESIAIIESDEPLPMKSILAMRISDPTVRCNCVASSCTSNINDADLRDARAINSITNLLASLQVNSDLVRNISTMMSAREYDTSIGRHKPKNNVNLVRTAIANALANSSLTT